jgi:hypothetical protein
MQILTRFNKVIAYNEYGYTPVGNSAICAVTGECHHDVLIVTVDYVPTDIDYYDYYYINGKFIKGSSNSIIVETNKRKKLQFWVGTQMEYAELSPEDRRDLFAIITDDPMPSIIEGVLNGEVSVGKAKTVDSILDNNKVSFNEADYNINFNHVIKGASDVAKFFVAMVKNNSTGIVRYLTAYWDILGTGAVLGNDEAFGIQMVVEPCGTDYNDVRVRFAQTANYQSGSKIKLISLSWI